MRPNSLTSRFLVVAGLAAVAGSCLGSNPLTNATFTCTADDQCTAGYVCQIGRCVQPCPVGEICGGWITAMRGEITTVGSAAAEVDGVRVVDDGFERGEPVCAGVVCVMGGLTP